MSRARQLLAAVTLAASVAACKEGGTIAVHSLNFKGVNNVDVARLKNALATRENSTVPVVGWQLPWGRKNYFDRGRFDADLKRIEAFYADRGFPDARVTDFDVKLNKKQDAVDVTLTIDEGQPVKVAAVEFRGFDAIPEQHLEQMKRQIPMTVGEPRDRQDVTAAHEQAVNELRDHGYPYARVSTDEDDGPNGKEATIVFTAEPGTLAHFGQIQFAGNTSVSDRVIERQLSFQQGDLYRRSIVQESQRRLYSMELFQFVNVESINPEQQRSVVDTRVTVAEGKAPAREFRRRIRDRGEGARRRRNPSRELPGRRADGRRARPVVVARSRHPTSTSTSPTFSLHTSRWAGKGSIGSPTRPRIDRS